MFALAVAFKRLSPTSAGIHTSGEINCKNINRQIKIFGKLLGQRISGSKKRWYPSKDEAQPVPSSLTKAKKQGKNTSRRVSVLNKLFMTHITDLLATGNASQEIVGKGLEISRIKVTPDFHGINVYWIATGSLQDREMEATLNKCSGILRHELSQLRLMGEVPKIRFVKDKSYATWNEVESVLEKCDFGEDHKEIDGRQMISDFTGYTEESLPDESKDDDEPLPPMRHDIFGLDHKAIMDKILTKMKRSRKAWDEYEQGTELERSEKDMEKVSVLEDIQRRMEKNEKHDENFEKFLKLKRRAKNTSERKKDYEFYQDETWNTQEEVDVHTSSKEEDDYIEEYEKDKM